MRKFHTITKIKLLPSVDLFVHYSPRENIATKVLRFCDFLTQKVKRGKTFPLNYVHWAALFRKQSSLAEQKFPPKFSKFPHFPKFPHRYLLPCWAFWIWGKKYRDLWRKCTETAIHRRNLKTLRFALYLGPSLRPGTEVLCFKSKGWWIGCQIARICNSFHLHNLRSQLLSLVEHSSYGRWF